MGVLIFLLFSINVCAKEITLQWDPNLEPDLAGYHVFYGELGATPDVLAVSTNRATIPDLFGGITYFFYVTALNTAGLESDPSVQIEYTVPTDAAAGPQLAIPSIASDGGVTVRGSGVAGGVYIVQSSEELNQLIWTDLQILTADLDGLMELRDTSSSPQKFYRLVEF